jgi:hypothetical protein
LAESQGSSIRTKIVEITTDQSKVLLKETVAVILNKTETTATSMSMPNLSFLKVHQTPHPKEVITKENNQLLLHKQ